MCGWIKSMRSEGATFLEKYPNANHLLNIIARRARRTKCNRQNLNVGECFVGFKSSGLSEQQYRTAKKQLTKWAFAEFKTVGKLTDSGTVARLMDSSVYDINIDDSNGRVTEEQRKANGKVTTNKESKKEKNENNKDTAAPLNSFSVEVFQKWWVHLPSKRKVDKKKSERLWLAATKNKSNDEVRLMANGICDYIEEKTGEDGKGEFMKHPERFIKSEVWNMYQQQELD